MHNITQHGSGDTRLTDSHSNNLLNAREGHNEFVAVRQSGTITRANTGTNGAVLFDIPPGAIIDDLVYYGSAGSNASGTAQIALGLAGSSGSLADGSAGWYLGGQDVIHAGAGLFHPSTAANMGLQPWVNDGVVIGQYAETGTPSTIGGPWTVSILYHRP